MATRTRNGPMYQKWPKQMSQNSINNRSLASNNQNIS